MNILILEDDKTRQKYFVRRFGYDVTIVETAHAAIDNLRLKDWDAVYLDHDLGGQQMVESGDNTGYEVAKWLAEHPHRQPGRIIIHSYNPVGRDNMKALLPRAIIAPGIWLHD